MRLFDIDLCSTHISLAFMTAPVIYSIISSEWQTTCVWYAIHIKEMTAQCTLSLARAHTNRVHAMATAKKHTIGQEDEMNEKKVRNKSTRMPQKNEA